MIVPTNSPDSSIWLVILDGYYISVVFSKVIKINEIINPVRRTLSFVLSTFTEDLNLKFGKVETDFCIFVFSTPINNIYL